MLHSIQNIEKVFDTGDKPVLVECGDLNAYVCKHNNRRLLQKDYYLNFSKLHLIFNNTYYIY